jgi:hypothetical protein
MSKFSCKKSFNRLTLIIIIISAPALLAAAPAFGTTDFILRATEQVYLPGQTLEIYGAASPGEVLVIRLYDPAGLAIRLENVPTDEEGFFRHEILTWPEPSRNFAFGTYTIEAISSVGNKDPQLVEVSFAGEVIQGESAQFPKTHVLAVKLDAPSEVNINQEFRVFVQVTFDGALVESANAAAVEAMLGSSHIHSANTTVILSNKFVELHPGLYYADVQLEKGDAYIIHAVAFYRGFLSHDSRVLNAGASIGTIQESVNELNAELGRLQRGLDDTNTALSATKTTITEQIELAQQASGQINSLILPVLALISVIIALQISLFARIRASYK